MVEKNKIEKSFDEYWAEEEKVMKMSYGVSKEWKALRLNKSPAKELVDRCEGRIKDGEKE
jgi:hypothetical protein|tara:strand:- start:711 stop:890 length:180 start_codon:yes stop_codon:yes gene_type:complete